MLFRSSPKASLLLSAGGRASWRGTALPFQLLLSGSFGQHHPNCSSPCLPSPRRIKALSSRSLIFEVPALVGDFFFFFFWLLQAVVSCQGMRVSGHCSFWLSWASDSDSCQCHFLPSDIIKGFYIVEFWFLRWLKHPPCPPVNHTASCQHWEFRAFGSCVKSWGV